MQLTDGGPPKTTMEEFAKDEEFKKIPEPMAQHLEKHPEGTYVVMTPLKALSTGERPKIVVFLTDPDPIVGASSQPSIKTEHRQRNAATSRSQGEYFMGPGSDSYEATIDAAAVVIMEVGASRMTLDAVAKKAGIGKEDLFHQFPTKEALLDVIMGRLIRARQELQQETLSGLPDSPGRELKARILTFLSHDQRSDLVGALLPAALALDPNLAEPFRKIVGEYYEAMIKAGPRFERAALPALAAAALLFHELLFASPFTEEERSGIMGELLKLADESVQ